MAATSKDQCHNCGAYGHFQRDCPNPAKKNRSKPSKSNWKKKGKKGSGGDPSPKWCSLDTTPAHSDSECRKQKGIQALAAHLALLKPPSQTSFFAHIGSAHLAPPRPPAAGQASYAHIGSAHTTPPSQPAPASFGFSFNAVDAAPSSFAGALAAEPAAKPAGSESAPAKSPQNYRLPPGVFHALLATTPSLSGLVV